MFLCPYCLFFHAFRTGDLETDWLLAEAFARLHNRQCAALRRIREAGERQSGESATL